MKRSARRLIGGMTVVVTCAVVGPAAGQTGEPGARLTMEQAIALALDRSPSLRAQRTTIDQARAQEQTAASRPNLVLQGDAQFLPLFAPGHVSANSLGAQSQFDVGLGYQFERGGKRDKRLEAARAQTATAQALYEDARRMLVFSVAQQYIGALLAESQLAFALEALKSFEHTVQLSDERRRAGDISENDFLKIRVQLLQFQQDVSAARLARAQAVVALRQLIGFNAVSSSVTLAGDLRFAAPGEDLASAETQALQHRPDLAAAKLAVTAANGQVAVAESVAHQDLTVSAMYSHQNDSSSVSTFFTLPLPTFNKNKGEIARTRSLVTQLQFEEHAAEDVVRADVRTAWEAVQSAADIVRLFESGYLKQAEDSRGISEFAYRNGAASLMDYLDAERSLRVTQMAYRQALAQHMLAVEQLRLATGSR